MVKKSICTVLWVAIYYKGIIVREFVGFDFRTCGNLEDFLRGTRSRNTNACAAIHTRADVRT